MLNVLDVVIIILLLAGALIGFKKGFIQSGVVLVGTIIVVILSFILKNPVSKLMYTYLPFFNFSGALAGVSVLNILIYEAIAFILIFALLFVIIRVLIIFTGIIEKILKFTVVLGIPSKILGALLGLAEAFIIVFVGLFVFSQFSISKELIQDSGYANPILDRTPGLSKIVSKTYNSLEEIFDLMDKYEGNENKDEFNLEALDILLKHEIIKPDSAKTLVEKEKITTPGASSIIEKYEVKE